MAWREQLVNPELDREGFFAIYQTAASERFAPNKANFEPPDVVNIQVEGRGTLAVRLENLWREFSQGGRHAAIVEKQLESVAGLLSSRQLSLSPEGVVPLIRNESYLRSMTQPPPVLCDHLVADIWIVYAIDQPGAMFPLTTANLPKLGIDRGDLRRLAMKNLPKVISRIEKHGNGPWHVLRAGNCYEASLLLIDGLWDQLGQTVTGDIVVVVPSRTLVLFTGSESAEGIEALRQRADEVFKSGDHPVSRTLLRRSPGQWQAF